VEGLRVEFEEEDDDDDGNGDWVGKGRWRRICVDGTVVECPSGGWVEVRKDGGRMAVDLVTESS
jgi:protein-L-isoaspartate O-methyltransferase